MKKFFLVLILCFLGVVSFSQELSESELESRKLFSESLDLLFIDKKYEARMKLNEAMTGEIYITDIPKFWYYAAKLDLQLGMVERAIQDLENALLFSVVNEEANTLLNFINNIKDFSYSNYEFPRVYELMNVHGVKNSFERFYDPIDLEVFNSNLYILDPQNHLIFKTNGQDETWIRLDKNKKYYSINSDKNLNRIYVSSNEGIYYFESFSPIIRKEVFIDATVESTSLTREVENELNTLIEGFPFIIYDVDNVGRLIGYDPYANEIKVIGFNGEILQSKKFENNNIFIDGAFWHNSLYLLEYESSSIFHFDILKNEVVKTIDLPEAFYLSIEVLPWDMIMLSSLENGIQLLSKSNEIINMDTELENSNFSDFKGTIKIKNGIVALNDLENNQVILHRIDANSKKDLYILNLYGLIYYDDERKVRGKLNISDISGQKMEFLTKNITVMDAGGRVPFNYIRYYSVSTNYKYEINDFFKIHMPQINTDANIITYGELNKSLSAEDVIPFILSNSSLFYLTETDSINSSLETLAYISGGMVVDKKYEDYLMQYLNDSYKLIDYIEYTLYPPIISDIKSTRITLLLQDKILVDTLFYYTGGDMK